MNVINLLHFYQPFTQQYDILDRIVNECYRPLLKGLIERKDAKTVVNINGVLTQLLSKHGYEDVLQDFTELARRGSIEFTGSAMYHALLPLIPKNEIKRQIMLNTEANKKVFGDHYAPKGFFSPELAINDKVLDTIKKMGFEWVAAPQISYGPEPPSSGKLYQSKGLRILFRNKMISSLILSATVRTAEDLWSETRDWNEVDKYWFTVMDAETFGHHRIGHQKLLFDILDSQKYDTYTAQELFDFGDLTYEETNLRASTWTNQEQDFWLGKNTSYILWNDPKNPIHKLQWKLTDLCVKAINSPEYKHPTNDDKRWKNARNMLDIALASDQYWWASAKPWWSLEMIESGAYELRNVIRTIAPNSDEVQVANDLYTKIIDKAFEWQRTGYIRKKHLEDSGTYKKAPFKERTPNEWHNQVILEFEYEMNKAAEKHDYERAIKWRDALLKIKQGTDIYDILHVVDELWLGRNVKWAKPQVKPFLQHDWEEFSEFAKQYFIGVESKAQFEEWKESMK